MLGVLSTTVVGLIVLGAAALALRKILKDKKAGKTSCGCGCEGCTGCHHPK